jgi:hypothetical protein
MNALIVWGEAELFSCGKHMNALIVWGEAELFSCGKHMNALIVWGEAELFAVRVNGPCAVMMACVPGSLSEL